MTAAVKARLDKAVANKRITSAQEQKMLRPLSDRRSSDLINATRRPRQGSAHRRDPAPGIRAAFGGRFARPGHLTPASAWAARERPRGSACARGPIA